MFCQRHTTNRYLGQLVDQMRDNNTVYGVLSTYTHTVFLRRVEDCRFEMTKAIPQTATQPSVRQCIMAAAILASENTEYHESPDFDPQMVRQEAFSTLRTCADKFLMDSCKTLRATKPRHAIPSTVTTLPPTLPPRIIKLLRIHST